MKRICKMMSVLAIALLVLAGCKKPTIDEVTGIDVEIKENPRNGAVLGTIDVSTSNAEEGDLSFTVVELNEGIDVGLKSGEVTVMDSSEFDYESSEVLNFSILVDMDEGGEEYADVVIRLIDVDESVDGSNNSDDPQKTVEERLADGETPFDIYQSDNSLLTELYGKEYQGGLIFYLNTSTGDGLVAAKTDQTDSIVWDPGQFGNLNATGATEKTVGKGMENSTKIMNKIGAGTYAAKLCDELTSEGKSDWHLPSLDELDAMYKNLHANGIGGFGGVKYWSSSELDANNAWYRDFAVANGQTAGTSAKVYEYAIRAVRPF